MLAFAGRLMLASIFLLSGGMKLVHHEEGPANPILQYMSPKMDTALEKFHSWTGVQLPVQQEQYPSLIFITGSMELLGGTLFVLNVKLGATLLIAALIPTTLLMHNFWDYPDASPGHQIEFMNFLKNIAVCGGLLVFASTPRPTALQAAKHKMQ